MAERRGERMKRARNGLIAIFVFTGILLDILVILFLIAGDRMEVTQMSMYFAMIASAMLTFKLMDGYDDS